MLCHYQVDDGFYIAMGGEVASSKKFAEESVRDMLRYGVGRFFDELGGLVSPTLPAIRLRLSADRNYVGVLEGAQGEGREMGRVSVEVLVGARQPSDGQPFLIPTPERAGREIGQAQVAARLFGKVSELLQSLGRELDPGDFCESGVDQRAIDIQVSMEKFVCVWLL